MRRRRPTACRVPAVKSRGLARMAKGAPLVVAAAAALCAPASAVAGADRCPGWGRPALAADPRPHALRVFAIQFEQRPGAMRTAADYRHAVDCAIRTEVLPHLARGRPNLVVFDEDIGLERSPSAPAGPPHVRCLPTGFRRARVRHRRAQPWSRWARSTPATAAR